MSTKLQLGQNGVYGHALIEPGFDHVAKTFRLRKLLADQLIAGYLFSKRGKFNKAKNVLFAASKLGIGRRIRIFRLPQTSAMK